LRHLYLAGPNPQRSRQPHLAHDFVGEERVEDLIGHGAAGGDVGQEVFDAGQLEATHGLDGGLGDAVLGDLEAVVILHRFAPLVEDALALVNAAAAAAQEALDGGAGAAGVGGVQPDLGRAGSVRVVEQGHQVEVVQGGVRLDQLVIDIKGFALVGQVGVDIVGVVHDGAAAVEAEELALRAEDGEGFGQRAGGRRSDLLPSRSCVAPPGMGQVCVEFAAHVQRGQPPPVDFLHVGGADAEVHAYRLAGQVQIGGCLQAACAVNSSFAQRVCKSAVNRLEGGMKPVEGAVAIF